MNRGFRKFDPYVLLFAGIASIMGLLAIFDAGYARSMASGKGMVPRELIVQLASLVLAVGLGVWVANVGVKKLFQSARGWWWLTIVLLVGVKIPGIGYEMNGADRWYKIWQFTVQPAEFAKLTAILFVAAALHNRKAWPKNPKRYASFGRWLENVGPQKLARIAPAIAVFLGIGLVVIEPDLGTGAVIAVVAWILFAVGGASRKSMVVGTLLCLVLCAGMIKMEPYRVERIANHMNRWDRENVDDTGFQTVQSELAMASGGAWGVGVGAGRVKHIMPAATTDFVTATVAEEIGFVGWCLMMLPLAGLTVRLLQLAPRAATQFGSLVMTGTAAWIGVQSVVNVMMANGTLPAIGIPLPFISSGGSSLIALWLALGVSQAARLPVSVPKEATVEADRDRWGNRRPRLSGA